MSKGLQIGNKVSAMEDIQTVVVTLDGPKNLIVSKGSIGIVDRVFPCKDESALIKVYMKNKIYYTPDTYVEKVSSDERIT